MYTIDLQTIYFSYILVNIINLILSGSLYFQIQKRFPGTLLIVLSMFMLTTGNVLVFIRNIIPDWLSIPLANILISSSLIVLLIGFEKFVNKKGFQIHNYVYIFLFGIIHTYFTYASPDINARHLNIAIAFMFVSFQIVYLMLKRAPKNMRTITSPVGYVFLVVFILQLFRVYYLTTHNKPLTRYFEPNSVESLFILCWQLIVILLAYSISLMYNKRLIIDVNAQEEKFSKAFHAAPFMIVLSKFSNGKIFEVNEITQTICGYKPKELIGKKTTDLKIWQNSGDRIKFLSKLKNKGTIFEKEYTLRKKSGEIFPGLISAEIVNINNEDCIVTMVNDITIRKEAELNLKKSEESLRNLNSTKDKFFSIIAHDLKSPFSGILGFSQILSEQVKTHNYEGIDEYAEIINTSSKHAVNLLSNLMEWSMSQIGRMEFNPEFVDINVILKSTLALLKTSSNQKSISININSSPNLILYVDKIMIEVVLRNLISNAIKFTPNKGTVSISIKEKEDHYLFSIVDNGVGIKKSNIDKLFRIDGSYSTPGTNNERGTGLGLILCKDFINYHQGKIWVESNFNIGSTFYFSLPKLAPHHPLQQPELLF